MRTCLCVLLALWLAMAAQARAVDLESHLEALRAVGPMGAGNREASEAWQQVVQADARQLPVVLAAMDDAGPLAVNWIRTAVDAIAERTLDETGALPTAELERFVGDTNHSPRARRTAYEWLVRVDPKAKRLIREMLDDPSLELRRDAVAQLIGDAVAVEELGNAASAVPLYRRAFSAARDHDQVKMLAKKLEGLGQEVDVTRHLGFITRWELIGPFDHTGESGFDVAYPPEKEIDLAGSYEGKHGQVGWIDYQSTHEYGLVDLNEAFEEEKGVIAYAMTEFVAPVRREVDIRLNSYNAVKVWVNGKLIGSHNVYHSGSQLDQYVSRATLEPGKNVILVKVCQNEQTQSWTKFWSLGLRVCDRLGTAVLSSGRE